MLALRLLLTSCLMLLLALPASAQTGTVDGRVTEADTGDPLPGVSVQLRGTTLGVATDRQGFFAIAGVPPGSYTLRFSSVGLVAEERMVTVLPGERVRVDVALAEATYQTEALVVTARRTQTATRSDTPVRLIPQALALVPARVLDEQQARDLPDVLRNLSGVVLSDVSNGFPEFRIRGFEAEGNGNYRKNGVEFAAVDDPLNANIERVEVLKGPASVLYGRLEPGGVVNLITKRPLPVPRYVLHLDVGSFASARAHADATGPLDGSARWLYRLNASYEQAESVRDEIEGIRLFAAPALTWLASDKVTWTVEGEAKWSERVVDPGLAALGSTTDAADRLPRRLFFGEPDAQYVGTQWLALSTLEIQWTPTWSVRSTVSAGRYTVDRDEIMLDSLGADGLLHRSILQQTTRYRYLQADVLLSGRVQTGVAHHKLTLGLDASHLAIRAGVRTPLTGTLPDLRFSVIDAVDPEAPMPTGLPLRDAFVEFVRADGGGYNLGAFVQDQVTLGRRLHVLVAGRLTGILSDAEWSALADTPDVPAGESTRTLDLAEVSPSAGVVYEPQPWLSLYTSVSRSFNPQINQVDERGEPFDPTYGSQVEAGAKLDLLGGGLTGGLAAFQLTKTNALTRESGSVFFEQTGAQRSRGLELDLLGQPLDGLIVIGSYAYLDAIVTADARIPEGNRLPAVPRHSGSLWAQYAWATGLLDGFSMNAGVFAAGDRFSSLRNDLTMPGYAVLDVGAAYAVSERVRVQLGVKNLLDARYEIGAATRQPDASGTPTLVNTWLAPPRSLRLTVTARF